MALPLVAALVVAACGDDSTNAPELDTIAASAAATSDLSTLVEALGAAGLVSTLDGSGPFTVFAPRNAAFAALDAGVLNGLLAEGNVDLLSRILTFHVVAGAAVRSGDLSDGQTVTTVEGGTLTIGVSGGSVTVNGAAVVSADIEASNGVVHIIDDVLVPSDLDVYETAVLTSGTTTLASAVLAGDLDGALSGTGPFTVFAPVNSAFEALDEYLLLALLDSDNIDLLQKVLQFHVVSGAVRAADLTNGGTATTLEGGTLTFDLSGATPKVNGVDITTTDIEVSNGVIHLVDGVLLPPLDIVETARLTGPTATLVEAIVAGGLDDDLAGAGPFTVFAPVNGAFETLGALTTQNLVSPANQDILVDLLTFHVIAGQKVMAADLTDGGTATTLEGGTLTFDLSGATPKVNGIGITVTDVEAENGVIHLIDGVLTGSLDVVQRATITPATETLVDAVIAADLVTTLKGPGPFTVFAPLNEDFAALGSTLDNLLAVENMDVLQDVLTYHVVSGTFLSTDLTDGGTLTTVEGNDIVFDLSEPTQPKVNGRFLNTTDILVENGVIHLVQGVLTEGMNVVERARVTDETSTLVAAVVAASTNGSEDLAATLSGAGPFTVFAPVNAAFAALGTDRLDVLLDPANAELLSDILRYHVIPGAKVMAADLAGLGGSATTYDGADVTFDLSGATPKVNGANIIATDIEVSNGVIHLIDGVLTENLDLVDVATVEGFSSLVGAVDAAGLTATLRSDNGGAGFTVFAPTNAAFATAFPSGLPGNPALSDVLTYHVLDSEVASSALSDGLVVTNTVNGASFTVNISGGSVTITDQAGSTVNVVLTDVPAANGIIHVIDGVISPTAP